MLSHNIYNFLVVGVVEGARAVSNIYRTGETIVLDPDGWAISSGHWLSASPENSPDCRHVQDVPLHGHVELGQIHSPLHQIRVLDLVKMP